MLFNVSSSSSNNNASLHSFSPLCFNSRVNIFIFTAFNITNILLLLPLCVLIILIGLRRWQKQRSASGVAMASHSDVFTFHLVAMELIGVLGCGLYCAGFFVGFGAGVLWMVSWGTSFFTATSKGQIFFHVLTCGERYLAVVHPITYMGLKSRGGVRIRNITIGFGWLIFIISLGTSKLGFSSVPSLVEKFISIPAVCFCNLSVLWRLKRPGPGDGGNDREQVNHSKIRAFHTITAIMVALLWTLGGQLLILVIYSSSAVSEPIRCVALVSGIWFGVPSSLVLPLLFLHRAGKH